MFFDYFFIALRNIRKRGLRSFLTLFGIIIGIAAVVSLISLGDGLREAIIGQFASLSADRLIVQSVETGFGPPGSTAVNKLTEHDLKLIRETSGVELAVTRIIRSGKLEFNRIVNFELVGSVPEKKEDIDYIYSSFNIRIKEGQLLEETDSGKVVLGNDYINSEDFEKKIIVGDRVKIQDKEFEVTGFLDKLGSVFFNSIILMPEKDMKSLFNIGDEIDLIAVKVLSAERVEEVGKSISEKLRKNRKEKEGEEDFSVQTPQKAFEAVSSVLNIVNIIVSGIAAISLLIGAVGVANVMYTSVLERTREIGVMKAVGAKRNDILMIFLIESGLLGLAGGIIGAFAGLFIAFFASYIANSYFNAVVLKIQISILLLLGAVFMSFFLGLLSGLFPARQAAQLEAVEALRR